MPAIAGARQITSAADFGISDFLEFGTFSGLTHLIFQHDISWSSFGLTLRSSKLKCAYPFVPISNG
jgi:hypothetical protein